MAKEPYHPSSLPVLDAAADLGYHLPVTAYKYAQGDATGKQMARAATNAAGWVFGLPSSQLSITDQYFYDQVTGQYQPEHPWSPVTDIIYRRKKH